MPHPPEGGPDRRLDSWKEIASFFGRNERTVRRWAKSASLPVHRIPGARGRVFAFEGELRRWLAASGEPETAVAVPQDLPQAAQEAPESPLEAGPPKIASYRSTRAWVVALIAAAALVLVVFRLSHRSPVHAWPINGPVAAKPTAAAGTASPAEDLYLQGRYYWNRRTPEDLNRAADYFNQAIAQDPNYAKAYVGLADTYSLLREYSGMPSNEAYPRALAAANKAVQLDDSSAEAHLSLAFVTFYWSWDGVGAEREFKRALALDPNDARAHHWYATFLLSSRRVSESLAEINKAQSLEPSSVAILADKGDVLNVADRADEAMALLKQIESTEPSFVSTHRYLSEIYFARKDYPAYLKEWKQMATLLKDQNELTVVKAAEKGFAAAGYEGMLRSALQAQKALADRGAVPAYSLAVTYARLGEKANSLQCLNTAYEKHDSSLLFLSNEPAFRILRDDPEFEDLEARVSPVSRPNSLATETAKRLPPSN